MESLYDHVLMAAMLTINSYARGYCGCCKNYNNGKFTCDIGDCQRNDRWEWKYQADALRAIKKGKANEKT